MAPITYFAQLPDFEYADTYIQCSRGSVSVPKPQETAINLATAAIGISAADLSYPTFFSISSEIQNSKELLNGGKHFESLKLIEDYLFKNFSLIAQAFEQTIQDESELPRIVTKLREEELISENTFFQVLDIFLILDGLKSQVNMGESLSERDFDLLANRLEVFHEISIVIATTSAHSLQRGNLAPLNYNGISQTAVNSSWYSLCYGSTFSTSSNTVTQASILDLM